MPALGVHHAGRLFLAVGLATALGLVGCSHGDEAAQKAVSGGQGGSGGTGVTSDAPGGPAAGGQRSSAAIADNGGGASGSIAGGAVGAGGRRGTGGQAAITDSSTGGASRAGTGGASGGGGAVPSTSSVRGATGGAASGGRTGGTGGSTGNHVVATVQSGKAQATDITQEEVRALVVDAVTQAGGLGFLQPGQTVVVKPNLLVSTSDGFRTLLPVTTNGITADWRVTKAVTELVRERIGASGKVLVMEGSIESTPQAFSRLGYTAANFGSDVDEFIPLEGTSCSDRSTTGLVQRTAASGKQYWMNERYATADAVISVAVMKTHFQAGITGGVKNLGIGATPASQYAKSGCGRDQRTLIPHSPVDPLSTFIAEYFSLKPADFVVMDGLQAVQHGPLPAWGGGNYESDRMNMRLILAARNAVALDTVEATIMGCDAKKVPHLTKLEAAGYGTTDLGKITVMGKPIAEVRKPFAGPSFACPGN